MRKTIYILIFLVLVVLSACNNESGEPQKNAEINVKGLKNVDVLNSHGSIKGLEKMSNFHESVQKGVPSNLRIVHYTTEGDPIVTDLDYNGEFLEVKHDSTRDKFGSGTITSTKCDNLIEEVNPTNTTYIAVDCAGGFHGMIDILQINYNVSQQDFFEFELKYTSNGSETQINSDFNITMDVKQEVYKRLVYANYIDEKDLIKTCDNEDAVNYFLKVYINNSEREFEWSACDQTMDGEKFTSIANYIMEQAENKQNIQTEETIQGYVLEIRENELLIGEGLTMLDYEWLKEELPEIDFNNYIFDFTIVTEVNTKDFNPGDKILATIEGSKSNTVPGRAKVKGIKKIGLD